MVFEHVTIKIDIGVSSFSDNPICLVLLLFWTQNRWRLKKKILETKWCQKMKLYPPNPRHVATSSLGAVLSHRSSAWQSGQCDGMRWHMHDGHLSYRVWNCPSQPCRIRKSLETFSPLATPYVLRVKWSLSANFWEATFTSQQPVFPGANLHVISQLSGASNHWLLHALPGPDARIQKMSGCRMISIEGSPKKDTPAYASKFLLEVWLFYSSGRSRNLRWWLFRIWNFMIAQQPFRRVSSGQRGHPILSKAMAP